MESYLRRGTDHLITSLVVPMLIILTCISVSAQPDISIHSQTLIRGFERDTVDEKEAMVLPVYQYVGLDIGDVSEEKVTFHMYGWGRKDLADTRLYEDDPTGDLVYGYAQFMAADERVRLKIGRQQIYTAAVGETVDGILVEGGLGDYLSLMAYGGLLPGFEDHVVSDHASIFGGRVGLLFDARLDAGLSYKGVDPDNESQDRRLGFDISLSPTDQITVTGVSQYNLETKGWAEHSYNARLYIDNFIVHPYYQRFEYEDLFSGTAKTFNPFSALAESDETLNLLGGELLWRGITRLDLGGKIENYTYDKNNNDALYTSGFLTAYVGDESQVGGEIGIMEGDLSENQYHLGRLWFLWNDPLNRSSTDFLTGDALYARYDEKIFNEDTSLFLSLGMGRLFLEEALSVKLSGDYSSDPSFDSDARVMITLTYNLNP